VSLPWLGLRQCDAEWPRSASEKNPTRFRSSDRIDGLGRGKINPSQPKLIQAKGLGLAWFYSSELGLFSGLQRFQIKNSPLSICLARGVAPALRPAPCALRPATHEASSRSPDYPSTSTGAGRPSSDAPSRESTIAASIAFSRFGTSYGIFGLSERECRKNLDDRIIIYLLYNWVYHPDNFRVIPLSFGRPQKDRRDR